MTLQGEKRYTYHQKLNMLENEINKLIRSKEGIINSLPVVLLDNNFNVNMVEERDLERRIRELEERILRN